jgi:hypothetical protein
MTAATLLGLTSPSTAVSIPANLAKNAVLLGRNTAYLPFVQTRDKLR